MKLIKNKKLRNTFYVLVLIVIISLVPLTAASAQETDPNEPTQDEVNAIAKQLYCPVCENVPLDVCGTQACAQWRELIREKLVEGWTEDEIKEYFSNQYGDRVLSEPPARGLNWLVCHPTINFPRWRFFPVPRLQSLEAIGRWRNR